MAQDAVVRLRSQKIEQLVLVVQTDFHVSKVFKKTSKSYVLEIGIAGIAANNFRRSPGCLCWYISYTSTTTQPKVFGNRRVERTELLTARNGKPPETGSCGCDSLKDRLG